MPHLHLRYASIKVPVKQSKQGNRCLNEETCEGILVSMHLTKDWYEEHIKYSKYLIPKKKHPVNKWANKISIIFNEEVKMANKYMKNFQHP